MEDDSEMQAMAEAEIEQLLQAQEELENIMRRLLVPKDARDDKNVFIEIRAGTGGDEAGILPAIYCACTPATPKHAAGKPKF